VQKEEAKTATGDDDEALKMCKINLETVT